MEGYQSLRGATPNPDVIRQAEAQIRDAQRNISYLEETLVTLQQGRRGGGGGAAAAGGGGGNSGSDGGGGVPGSRSFDSSSGARTPVGGMMPGGGRGKPGSYSSSIASNSSLSSSGRPYPGDSSSSYLSSQTSTNPHGNYGGSAPKRFDDRTLPSTPGSDGGGFGGPYDYRGTPRSDAMGFQGRPAQQTGPGAMAHVNRAGTSARRNYTNLGEKEWNLMKFTINMKNLTLFVLLL